MKICTFSILVFFTFIVSSFAFADWNGSWKGEGSLTVNGKTFSCETIELTLQQTPTSLTIAKEHIHCGSLDSEGDMQVLSIKDGGLYYGKTPVGSIKDDKILLLYVGLDSTFQVIYERTVDSDPKAIHYLVDGSGLDENGNTIALTLDGQLKNVE